jgi:hypothetical protein
VLTKQVPTAAVGRLTPEKLVPGGAAAKNKTSPPSDDIWSPWRWQILFMKTTGLILLLLTGFSVAAQANPAPACCRHPVRVFGNQTTVNLTPLFHWWTDRARSGQVTADTGGGVDASRPLTAWRRVTGFKTGELGADWVVNAVIQASPGDTNGTRQVIILKHPPVAEEHLYYDLKNRLAAAPQQITADQRIYETETRAAAKASARAQAFSGASKQAGKMQAQNYRREADQHKATAAAALKEQQELSAAYPQVQKELDAIPAADGHYQIDWFALTIGRNSQGITIFDLGALPEKTR